MAVGGINRSICNSFVLIGLLFVCFFTHSNAVRQKRSSDPCAETRSVLTKKGLHSALQFIPTDEVNGKELHFCPMETTCCTSIVEENLVTQSNLDFEHQVVHKCALVEHLLSNKTAKVDKFFHDLVDNAKESLDGLFYQTYGSLYADNSQIFMNLFDDLKRYYHGEAIRMNEIFDDFFTSLTQKVFKLMHQKRVIDEDYMQCIGENINAITPFDGMPEKLSSRVHRAFDTARSFIHGLEVGRDLSMKVAKFDPTAECAKAFMKMTYCSKCKSHVSSKPCRGLCLNVMKGCLRDYSSLNAVWNEYIDMMQMLLNKLDSPYNIQSVLDPIAIKISEAIMTLQEKKMILTKQVFDLCGEPALVNVTDPASALNLDFTKLQNVDLSAISPADLKKLMDLYPNARLLDGFGSLDSESSSSTRTRRSTNEEPAKNGRKHRRSRSGGKRRKDRKYIVNSRKPASHDRDYSFIRPVPDITFDYEAPSLPNSNLDVIVVEMRQTLTATKNHWSNLPQAVCYDLAESDDQETCWNGETEGPYTSPKVEERSENPEIIGNIPAHVIKTQSIAMRNTISELRNAYRGYNPAIGDEELTAVESSADGDYSGSGEGSADTSSDTNRKLSDEEPLKTENKCPTCGSSNLRVKESCVLTLGVLFARWVLQL